MSEPEQIVEAIARQTKNLMANHWIDIDDFRDGEEKIKVGFSHYITYQGQERIIETMISFSKRMKDSLVERIETEQMPLKFSPEPEEPVQSAKRGRGRPKKNILEMTLKSEPKPDNA